MQDFQRHRPIEALVVGFVDCRHTAGSQSITDSVSVVGRRRAWQRRPVRWFVRRLQKRVRQIGCRGQEPAGLGEQFRIVGAQRAQEARPFVGVEGSRFENDFVESARFRLRHGTSSGLS